MKILILVLSLCVLAASAARAVPSGCQEEELAVTVFDDRPVVAKTVEQLRHDALCRQIAVHEDLVDLSAHITRLEDRARNPTGIVLIACRTGIRFARAVVGMLKAEIELDASSLEATEWSDDPYASADAAAANTKLRADLTARVLGLASLIAEAEHALDTMHAERPAPLRPPP